MRLAIATALVLVTPAAWGQCPPETIVGSDTVLYDRFGNAVAASGSVVVVGAPSVGKAYIFEWTAAAPGWLETEALVASQRLTRKREHV